MPNPLLPDLVISNIIYSRQQDGSIAYQIIVQNQGSGNAENPFSGSLYGRRTDGSYLALGAFTLLNLPFGAIMTRTGTIPQNLSKGLVSLLAAIDDEVVYIPAEIRSTKNLGTIDDDPVLRRVGFTPPYSVSESSETNNIFIRSLR